jgi:hypothetical protein
MAIYLIRESVSKASVSNSSNVKKANGMDLLLLLLLLLLLKRGGVVGG